MKLTPSSTARRKTFFAFSRSGGHPQIPSPVRRIAPNPSRFTVRSPPNCQVDPVEGDEVAANIALRPAVNSAAPLPAAIETNFRRVKRTAADDCFFSDRGSSLITQSTVAPVEGQRPRVGAISPADGF